MKRILFLLLFIPSMIFSGTSLSKLEEVVTLNSRSYQSAQISYNRAISNLNSVIDLEDTRINLGVSGNEDETDINYSLTVPVVDQLELKAYLNSELDGNLGVSINPFNWNSEASSSNLNYKSAQESLKLAYIEASSSGMSTLLNWVITNGKVINQTRIVELKSEGYKESKLRYDTGDITLDDLTQNYKELSEARKELLKLQYTLRELQVEMVSVTGGTVTESDLNTITEETILDRIKELKKDIDLDKGDYLKDPEYLQKTMETESKKSELDYSWYYNPQLTSDINFDITDSEVTFSTFSINYSFSLNDVGIEERELAQSEYELALLDSKISRSKSQSSFLNLVSELESVEITHEILKQEYSDAEILLMEANILYESGDYSYIELKEKELSLESARLEYFSSLIDEYTSLLTFRKYM